MNRKLIGLILLSVGIGVTGATGAALSEDYRDYLALKGELQFAEKRAEEAHEAWCELRVAAIEAGASVDGALEDGCEVEGVEPLEEASDAEETRLPSEARLSLLGERIQESEDLDEDIQVTRREWIVRLAETIPRMRALEKAETVTPQRRVSQWLEAQGGGFGLGLLLVVIGAFISRRAIQAEFTSEDESAEDGGAVDFGELLQRVVTEAESIQSEMTALVAPTVGDLDRIQERVERLQKDDLERLLGAGPRLQIKVGIGPFAEIFSPLAGAERRLNRLWSTLVDRHWPEAVISMDVAVSQLQSAQQAFSEAQKAA